MGGYTRSRSRTSISGCIATEGGKPGRFALVHARHSSGVVRSTRADGRGAYSFRDLDRGVWTVSAVANRGDRCSTGLAVDVAAQPIELDVDLERATASLTIRLEGRSWEPIDTAEIVLTHVATGRRASFAVSNGWAHATGLPAGDHLLEVPASHRHRATSQLLTGVRAGVDALTTVELQPGARVLGRVSNGDGSGMYASRVSVIDSRGAVMARGRTDAEGWFALGEGVPESADLTLVVRPGPGSSNTHGVTIPLPRPRRGAITDVGHLTLLSGDRTPVWSTEARSVAAMSLPGTRV